MGCGDRDRDEWGVRWSGVDGVWKRDRSGWVWRRDNGGFGMGGAEMEGEVLRGNGRE